MRYIVQYDETRLSGYSGKISLFGNTYKYWRIFSIEAEES